MGQDVNVEAAFYRQTPLFGFSSLSLLFREGNASGSLNLGEHVKVGEGRSLLSGKDSAT